MTRYGYYDPEVQPQAPIDELSTGGPLPEPLDPDAYERSAESFDPEHQSRHHREKATAKS